MSAIPKDVHRAIGDLLEYVGSRDCDLDAEADAVEESWNLVREWWSQVPVNDNASGINPYPES